MEDKSNKKPMDIVAEQKLEKWLHDVGLSDNEGFVTDNQKEGADTDKEAE